MSLTLNKINVFLVHKLGMRSFEKIFSCFEKPKLVDLLTPLWWPRGSIVKFKNKDFKNQ